MDGYNIQSADNGWIVSWWEETEKEMVQHYQVFEVPEEIDDNHEDPQALIDLLYFVKETICGQYYSKHKKKNVLIRFEDEADENLG